MSWFFFLAVLFVTFPPFFLCFRFPRPFLPNTLSLPVYHFLIFFLASSFFGVEQLVIVLGLAAFSRLCRYFHYWSLTLDSQSFYSGMDTLWYSSVDYFLSSTQLGVVLLRRAGSGKYSFRSRSSMRLLIRVPLRRTTLIPASSSKREKWTDSPRSSSWDHGLSILEFQNSMFSYCTGTPSQVSIKSSPRYDSSSLSQSRRICIPRRLLVWRQFHRVYDHQNQKLNIHFKFAGSETSLNPGSQQGICFPVSLTGKMR